MPSIMTFGKHRGSLISEIPLDYIRWGAREFVAGTPVREEFVQELINRSSLMDCLQPVLPQKTGGCQAQYNPLARSDLQPWDGVTAPWLDQVS